MKRRTATTDQPLLITIPILVLIAIAISIGMIAILSLLSIKEVIGEQSLVYIIPALQCMVSFVCALIAGKRAAGKYALVCGGTALGYCLTLIGATVLFFNGQFRSLGIGVIMCATGAIVACLLCARKGTIQKKTKAYM